MLYNSKMYISKATKKVKVGKKGKIKCLGVYFKVDPFFIGENKWSHEEIEINQHFNSIF